MNLSAAFKASQLAYDRAYCLCTTIRIRHADFAADVRAPGQSVHRSRDDGGLSPAFIAGFARWKSKRSAPSGRRIRGNQAPIVVSDRFKITN